MAATTADEREYGRTMGRELIAQQAWPTTMVTLAERRAWVNRRAIKLTAEQFNVGEDADAWRAEIGRNVYRALAAPLAELRGHERAVNAAHDHAAFRAALKQARGAMAHLAVLRTAQDPRVAALARGFASTLWGCLIDYNLSDDLRAALVIERAARAERDKAEVEERHAAERAAEGSVEPDPATGPTDQFWGGGAAPDPPSLRSHFHPRRWYRSVNISIRFGTPEMVYFFYPIINLAQSIYILV